MAISSAGIGSGLDVNSIVTQLVALEKQPLQELQTKATTLQSKLSLYGTIQSQASALQDAATVLSSPVNWAVQTATSSNTAAVTVAVDSTAVSADLGLDVTRLAQAQTTASRSIAAGTAIGPGSGSGILTLQLGSWGAAGTGPFVAGSSAAVPINVQETDNYAAIAKAINLANAGVTASVLTSGGVDRLTLRSTTSGKDAGFTLTSDGGFANLDSLSFTSLSNPTESALGMESSQKGLNATFKINGVSMESASNTVTGVVTGVTFNLLQTTVSGSPVQLAVTQDKAAVQKNIQAFADAYTALNKTLADSTKYVPGGKSGVLQGDSTTVGLQSLMKRIISSSSVGSTLTKLSQAGLQQQTDGSLKVVVDVQGTGRLDNLKSAMSDMANLQKLFTTDNSNSATNGFALKMRDFAKGLLAADGTVSNKRTALQGSITRNGEDQDRVNARASRVEIQLRRQYSALDAQMSNLSGLSSYVTAQLAQWNKTS